MVAGGGLSRGGHPYSSDIKFLIGPFKSYVLVGFALNVLASEDEVV